MFNLINEDIKDTSKSWFDKDLKMVFHQSSPSHWFGYSSLEGKSQELLRAVLSLRRHTHKFRERTSRTVTMFKILEQDLQSIKLLLYCLVSKLCWTLCDPVDSSLPASSIHGISQVKILEWVASSFSRVCSQPRDRT